MNSNDKFRRKAHGGPGLLEWFYREVIEYGFTVKLSNST
jgi:hypothetical protein